MRYKLLVLALFFGLSSSAQMKQGKFVFGPKIGFQAAKIHLAEDPSAVIESKLSAQYQVGVFGRLNMGKVSFQPEAIFNVKGGTFSSPDEKHSYRYLSTPILLGVSPFDGLFLEAGPEFSWALNQGWKKVGVAQYGPDAKTDKAIVIGARVDLLDMFSMFSVNLRYTHGLDNMTTRVSNTNPYDFRNRTFQVSVTYNLSEYYKWWKKYGLKKK